MNCTYAVFMLGASLPEGTRGVTNVGGLTANLDQYMRTGTPHSPYQDQSWEAGLRNKNLVSEVENMKFALNFWSVPVRITCWCKILLNAFSSSFILCKLQSLT